MFCKAVKDPEGSDVKILFKNEKIMVVLNKYPYNPGHLMVVPTRHVENLTDLDSSDISYLFNKVAAVINLLKIVYNPPGFNIGLNIGENSGASIKHLHIHIVPRYRSESGFMEVTAGTRVLIETIEQTYNLLLPHVSILKD
ncbi:MAG: HIT domain-containing protein [Candidatus Odinarchaeum yellowstonii]|uniref:HIT domain-containing protein n=1 Tax=Odinarchaeota yellowstonii (strain LCB_4) TaxID=1841599 RepID=A0AAF0D4P6_ODILC|nr:MAG: HIT domain-containing protein [Candidatus Odinarchaeum yellowstonii]